MRKTSWLAVVAVFILGAAPALAASIPVDSVTTSSTFFSYDEGHLVDGSGLTGDLHDEDWRNMWIADHETSPWLVFDLGEAHVVGEASVWNYNSTIDLGRGIRDLDVSVSLDGIDYSGVGSWMLVRGTGGAIAPDVLDLGGVTARYVRFDARSNHGSTGYTGLSEVAFDSVSTPEPAALALFGLGLGLVGLGLRRRARRS